ncbi:MAG: hypothetical protein V1906_03790 [Candidatus Woesearchaeota archaeon]
MKLTTILLAGTLALSSASCGPAYLGEIGMYERIARRPTQITDDSDLGKYYLSGRYKSSFLKREKAIYSDLEKRIEYSMGRHFSREIDIQKPYQRDLGHTVIVSERGEMKYRYEKHILAKLSRSEQRALAYIAERRDLYSMSPFLHRSRQFKELSELMKKTKLNEYGIQRLNRLNSHFNIPKSPRYAATVSEIKGFAPYFMIFLDEDPEHLHSLVQTWAHEGAHTLFFVTGGIYESMFRNLPINETACDLIGDRVADRFVEDHIQKGSRLEKVYLEHKAFSEKIQEVIMEVAIMYKSFPKGERKNNRENIISQLEKYAADRTGFKIEVNEAKLMIWDRYSGSKKRRDMLDSLEKIIGPNLFLNIVPKFRNDKELEKAHATFKKYGKGAFGTVVYELDKLHYANMQDSMF